MVCMWVFGKQEILTSTNISMKWVYFAWVACSEKNLLKVILYVSLLFSTCDVTWGPEQVGPGDVATAQLRRQWAKDEFIILYTVISLMTSKQNRSGLWIVKAAYLYYSQLQTWLQTWFSTRFAARFSTSSCGFATRCRLFVENLVANRSRFAGSCAYKTNGM